MKKKPILLIDLDDTLLDFHRAEAIALSGALRAMDVEPRKEILELYSKINAEQWKRLEKGLATRQEILLKRFELLFSALGIERSGEEARDRYEDNLCIGHYFIEGAPELLEELYRDYELYIISNGTGRVQKSRLESAGIERYFRGIFISEALGANKPSPEFFRMAAERIEDFSPDRALVIGDSLSSDILGGINSGIKTLWFNPGGKACPAEIRPDYTVASLREIPALLHKIFA